jgi:hypothetical protein
MPTSEQGRGMTRRAAPLGLPKLCRNLCRNRAGALGTGLRSSCIPFQLRVGARQSLGCGQQTQEGHSQKSREVRGTEASTRYVMASDWRDGDVVSRCDGVSWHPDIRKRAPTNQRNRRQSFYPQGSCEVTQSDRTCSPVGSVRGESRLLMPASSKRPREHSADQRVSYRASG